MFEIPSKIEGKQMKLYNLEMALKPQGFVIGGNWDYDHGSFDYKLGDEEGYQFLRLPFEAVDGQLDVKGCAVKLGRPFVLSHVYQEGLDDHADTGNLTASFNQFAEPKDPDANIPGQYIEKAKSIVKELEETLIQE